VTWHHPIGREVTGYSPLSAVYWVGQMGTGGLWQQPHNGIHPKRERNHQLLAGEIPSLKSPVMSCNMAQAGRLHSPNLVRPPQALP